MRLYNARLIPQNHNAFCIDSTEVEEFKVEEFKEGGTSFIKES